MTAFDRFDPFERRITDAIDEIAGARPPEYLTDILRLTARSSQRPRWTFLERWLPVGAFARQSVLADGVRLRPLLVVAMVALLAAAAVGAGLILNQPAPVMPAPYGPAGNGLMAFSTARDLYVGDPMTGGSRLLAADVGSAALFDRTGTRIATTRTNPPNTVCYGPPPVPVCTVDILLTTLDGRSVVITREALPWPVGLRDWSADGRHLLITGVEEQLAIVATDGSGVRPLAVAATNVLPVFAPPDSASVWIDEGEPAGRRPLRVGLDGTVLSRFPALAPRENLEFAPSPDGRRIAIGGSGSALVIASIDGSIERQIDFEASVDQLSSPVWSPDGSALIIEVIRDGDHGAVIVDLADPGNLRAFRPLLPPASTACSWSPDGALLSCSTLEGGQWWIVDRSGVGGPMTWPGNEISYAPSWQRLPLVDSPE